jgi:hypothetical protein
MSGKLSDEEFDILVAGAMRARSCPAAQSNLASRAVELVQVADRAAAQAALRLRATLRRWLLAAYAAGGLLAAALLLWTFDRFTGGEPLAQFQETVAQVVEFADGTAAIITADEVALVAGLACAAILLVLVTSQVLIGPRGSGYRTGMA